VSTELDRDLGAWAREELSRERLLAVHGSAAASILEVHDRLTGAAAAVAAPAAESGWAALLAKIDAPAPVIPLRRPRARRTLSIAVAAALAFAGIAYAVASRGSHGGSPTAPAVSAPILVPPPSAGAGSNDRRTVHAPNARAGSPSAGGPSGAGSSSPGGPGTTTRGVDGGGGGTTKPRDDPHDRDQGTGNDGPHNDHGSGNNGPEGSPPPNSHGH
jgi:hypothetical protein